MASEVLNFGVSQTQDSDEIKEMYCEECDKHLSKYKPAEGFCVDCCVYMCDMCIMYHRRYMQQHNLKDKSSMPQDFCFEKCADHPNELIKFFCEKCDKIACNECRKHNHSDCKTVKHLPTIVQGVEQSEEFKDLLKDMDDLSADLEDTKKQLQTNVEYITSQEKTEKLKIRNHRDKLVASYSKQQKDIIENFDKEMEETIAKLRRERQKLVETLSEKKKKFEDKLKDSEEDVTKKIENSKNSDQTNLDSLMKKTLILIDELKTSSADLVQKQNLGQKCYLFITMKATEENTRSIENSVSELKMKNRIKYFRTDPSQTDLTIGALETTTNFFSYEDTTKSRIERTATFHSDIKTNRYGLLSSCLLSVDTLVVTNYIAKSLLIFKNIMQNKPSFKTIDMGSGAWGITKVEDNKVAVTIPDKETIKLITFSDSMTVSNTDDIKVEGLCVGVACGHNNLIVSYASPGKVQILDMSGRVLKCFDKDSNGKPLFSLPYYLALSPNNTTIYVSGWGDDTVTSLSLDGKVKAIYKDDQLRNPNQLTVDESGAVYVCANNSNNVHQLSADLNKVMILLDRADGIDRSQSIAYCQKKDRLYVGMYSGNIKVFNISPV